MKLRADPQEAWTLREGEKAESKEGRGMANKRYRHTIGEDRGVGKNSTKGVSDCRDSPRRTGRGTSVTDEIDAGSSSAASKSLG
jgi:hypothetical protein